MSGNVLHVHRRGYDVVDFAKQGAVSVTGMELVPEAVSTVDPSPSVCSLPVYRICKLLLRYRL